MKHRISWLSLIGEIGGIKGMLVEGMELLVCLFGLLSVAKGCADGAQKTNGGGRGATLAESEEAGQLEMNGSVENDPAEEEHGQVVATPGESVTGGGGQGGAQITRSERGASSAV